jgi:hypothetical protein
MIIWFDTKRVLRIASIFLCLSTAAANAGGMCSGDGQILVPPGTCLNGYSGYKIGNCLAVKQPVGVEVSSGLLTCIQGPSCPSGYAQGMPPPLNGAPGYPPGNKGLQFSPSECIAVCAPLFVNNNWPCSCPYGQHIDSQTHACAPICGGGAMWSHTPGYDSQVIGNGLVDDDGVCTCPNQQDYIKGPQSCVPRCPPGQSHDAAGGCHPNGGGGGGVFTPKYCSNGQKVGACTCPPGGQVKNGTCYVCSLGMGTSGTQCQPAGCPSGKSWDEEAKTCVANPPQPKTCPPGTHFNQDGVCVKFQTFVPMCQPGNHWNGTECVMNVAACPPGTTSAGDGCKPLPGGPCQPGYVHQGLACIPEHQCPFMHHWDGKSCAINVTECGPNAHLNGLTQRCVPNN